MLDVTVIIIMVSVSYLPYMPLVVSILIIAHRFQLYIIHSLNVVPSVTSQISKIIPQYTLSDIDLGFLLREMSSTNYSH